MFRIKFYKPEQQPGKQTKKGTKHPNHLKWAFCLFLLIFSQKKLRRNLQIHGQTN